MDKNAIKKYAVWARRELIKGVSTRAAVFGITEKDAGDPNADSVGDHLLAPVEKSQRQALIHKIRSESYEQVMEEVAYTWFNRFAALRFMEVNGYLPSHVRVFTNADGEFKPQILAEAIQLELEGLDKKIVYQLEEETRDEELYKYLLIVQCNALSGILPGMFQPINDYTELLFPDKQLHGNDSVIRKMVTDIQEKDWTDQVQIIGWLYQYYISEKKDQVFADLKKNIKISKENIPAATQLFTPDWIVRYMVENSLGRLWLEHLRAERDAGTVRLSNNVFPTKTKNETGGYTVVINQESDELTAADELKKKWRYYIDDAEQDEAVEVQLKNLRENYKNLNPMDIKVIDPCMGSGHILCVLFDVLIQIYESYGYTAREAVRKIIENNLYGLDIDERAAQLAYFSVMMKARQYDRRFFAKKDAYGQPDVPRPHVYPIIPSSRLDPAMVKAFMDDANELFQDARPIADNTRRLIEQMKDADEYGSIITVKDIDFSVLYNRYDLIVGYDQITMIAKQVKEQFLPFLRVAEMLSMQYDIVVTNPPYMGSSGMDAKLGEYLKKEYPDSKSDLSTVFMEKCLALCNKTGYMAMINIPVWMFLSSYEKLRKKMIADNTYFNMVHPGRGIFGSDFGTTMFVIAKQHIEGYNGSYRRLFDVQGEVKSIEERRNAFLSGKGKFTISQSNFSKIPGSPVAYWVSNQYINAFSKSTNVDEFYDFTGAQHKTADNEKYLRMVWEVDNNKIKNKQWIFYAKGGEYRKWYGNIDLVVDWTDSAKKYYQTNITSNMIKEKYWFQEGITYTSLSSANNGFRYLPPYGVFDIKGPSIIHIKSLQYCLGFYNTKIAQFYFKLLNPTITLQVKDVKNTPLIYDLNQEHQIHGIVDECVEKSKIEWDSFETSWDFKKHPFVRWQSEFWDATAIGATLFHFYGEHPRVSCPLELCYLLWQGECNERFNQLKANEEELNRIFIDIYGLQDELTPEVEDKDVTVRKADLGRDIRSFISYAVGCMFGRYSPDKPGLIFAGGEFDDTYWQYKGHAALDKYGNEIDGEFAGISNAEFHYPALRDSAEFRTATRLSYEPDPNNIIPITDDEYFEDDIVGYFVRFVKTVYGEETLEANLQFITDALGGKGTARQVIRNYFLNDFYADHLKIYQKRPIYWLFDSGKKNGFKCLIYMHRYQPDTIARIRTDYVHGQQSRYRTAIADLEQRMKNTSTAERVKISRQLDKIKDQAEELRVYEEKIHHLADQMISIDLDDGVKENYAKFQDVLARIK